MKMIRHGFDRKGADIGGEVSVQRAKPLALREPAVGPEAGDLPEGMNPGIGPACADDREPGLGDCCEGLLHRRLDSRRVQLALPPGVLGSVVLEDEFKGGHKVEGKERTLAQPAGACHLGGLVWR
jgi:hypothetical protein